LRSDRCILSRVESANVRSCEPRSFPDQPDELPIDIAFFTNLVKSLDLHLQRLALERLDDGSHRGSDSWEMSSLVGHQSDVRTVKDSRKRPASSPDRQHGRCASLEWRGDYLTRWPLKNRTRQVSSVWPKVVARADEGIWSAVRRAEDCAVRSVCACIKLSRERV
jgi:hypothetical protein